MAATLVTLAQAKDHLGITTATPDPAGGDADVQLKLDQAEAGILERCSATTHWAPIAAAWTAGTVPLLVQAAILTLLAHLVEHRGDDMTNVEPAAWAAIDRLIALNKDPVIA